ncbi:hypothetical protein EVAR_54647_1 [Eumeta japonica]|uniref:Uncharacterized protein n=1 Tax=Eumeta variegata TaxID=151549 RepID=A0A4C1X8J3_EUMVA|nr:hypothetical protein EVAR_54647_1 [Eumeta japonica]
MRMKSGGKYKNNGIGSRNISLKTCRRKNTLRDSDEARGRRRRALVTGGRAGARSWPSVECTRSNGTAARGRTGAPQIVAQGRRAASATPTPHAGGHLSILYHNIGSSLRSI